jgi:hypothetical protein
MRADHRRFLCALAFGLLTTALACQKTAVEPVRAVAVDGQDEVRAVVGAEGGELRLGGKEAWLEIPKGVLQEEVSMGLRQVAPTFDLAGKDFVGKAYRISPRITFAPGAAKLYVPVDRELPGPPADIHLQMYFYDKAHSGGPEGPGFVHNWVPQPLAKFAGFSQDQRYLVFWIYETISDRSTKAPFGLFQAAFDLEP